MTLEEKFEALMKNYKEMRVQNEKMRVQNEEMRRQHGGFYEAKKEGGSKFTFLYLIQIYPGRRLR